MRFSLNALLTFFLLFTALLKSPSQTPAAYDIEMCIRDSR